jgi:hypothetical protein
MKNYRIELRWALIFVIMTLLWMLMEKLSGLHDRHIELHPVFTNLIFIPAITIYVLALRDKKKNFYKGVMTYMQGFKCGIIISLIVTAINPLTQFIISEVITPEYFNNAISMVVESGKMTREAAVAYFNLRSYILQGMVGVPVMGILSSAIVAAFVRSGKTT